MENNELFKTIEQLKETLSEISSARRQVTETVEAYAQTQTEIQTYINNLNGIESGLSKLIGLLQNNKTVIAQQSDSAVNNMKASCDVIVAKTKENLTMVSDKFTDATNSVTETLSSQISKFDRTIEKAGTLDDNVKTMSGEVSGLVTSVKVLQQELVSLQKAQDDALTNIMSSLSNQDSVLNLHGQKMQVLVESVNSASHSIQTKLDELKEQQANSKQDTDNQLKTIKYIGIVMVIGLIIIGILPFVIK